MSLYAIFIGILFSIMWMGGTMFLLYLKYKHAENGLKVDGNLLENQAKFKYYYI